MPHNHKEMFSRNIGLLTEEDQRIIESSTVGIAGTGADGGLTSERLIRMGLKSVKLSDPESFDLSNINRQFGATTKTVGKNKCETVAIELKRIREDLVVETFPEGINSTNSAKFVAGCQVVLDEIEYTIPKASIALHKAARKEKIDVIAGLNLGYGINIFRFSHTGIPFEELINFDEHTDEKTFRMESLVPNIPEYVDPLVVKKVLAREGYIPTVSPTIGLLAGELSFIVMGLLTKKWSIPAVPNFLHIDMYNRVFEIKNITTR